MKRTMLRGALVLLLVGFCTGAWSQGDFALEYRLSEKMVELPFAWTSQWLTANEHLPDHIPDGLEADSARSFTARIAGRDVLMVTTDRMDPKTKLYLDFNRDGRISDSEVVRKHTGKRYRWYGPVALPVVGSKQRLEARFNIATGEGARRDEFVLVASPAGSRSGKVELGGVTFRIAIVDANFNGTYNDACDSFDGNYESLDADCLGIDLNGDGRLNAWCEFCPLSKMIRVRDAFYSLTVLPDGSKVRLRQVKPQLRLGQLDVGSTDVEMVVFCPEVGVIPLGGARRTWRLPAGGYTILDQRLAATDQRGARWELHRKIDTASDEGAVFVMLLKDFEGSESRLRHVGLRGKEKPRFTIQAGETTTLKLGTPLRVVPQVDIRRPHRGRRRTVVVQFEVRGQGDERYRRYAWRKRRKRECAAIRFIDKRGKVLESGRFEREELRIMDDRDTDYIEGGPADRYVWKVPASFKGTFRVEIDPKLGPFRCEGREKWHTIE